MTNDPAPEPAPPRGLSRRALLVGAGAGIAAGAAVGAAATAGVFAATGSGARADAVGVAATGAHQAGVDRPASPQPHCLVTVADLDTSTLRESLAALGDAVRTVTAPGGRILDVTPDGAGDLTVTIGLGPRALAATARPDLRDLVALPEFAGDAALPAERRGGDILIGVNASDPTVLEPVSALLAASVAGHRTRWSELGFRGPLVDGAVRNPIGYRDGIIIPRTTAELDADVWIADGPLAGGTICVIRRFRLDAERFRALPDGARDAVIGRRQADGAPLSGGGANDQVDLNAKTDEGEPLVPARAHVRAAHPSFTGSGLMLRRSYGYRASADDHGHLFISYQNDVATFSRTQLRLDEVDDLMGYATPTATAAFAILPGVEGSAPLGGTLF